MVGRLHTATNGKTDTRLRIVQDRLFLECHTFYHRLSDTCVYIYNFSTRIRLIDALFKLLKIRLYIVRVLKKILPVQGIDHSFVSVYLCTHICTSD